MRHDWKLIQVHVLGGVLGIGTVLKCIWDGAKPQTEVILTINIIHHVLVVPVISQMNVG